MNYQTIDFIYSLYLSHCILYSCKFIYFNFDQVLDIGRKLKKNKTCMKVFFYILLLIAHEIEVGTFCSDSLCIVFEHLKFI